MYSPPDDEASLMSEFYGHKQLAKQTDDALRNFTVVPFWQKKAMSWALPIYPVVLGVVQYHIPNLDISLVSVISQFIMSCR